MELGKPFRTEGKTHHSTAPWSLPIFLSPFQTLASVQRAALCPHLGPAASLQLREAAELGTIIVAVLGTLCGLDTSHLGKS